MKLCRKPRVKHYDMLVGQRLREIRTNKDMSMSKLAEHAGLSRQQVHQYETGISGMRASTIKNFSEILEVEPGDFFIIQQS